MAKKSKTAKKATKKSAKKAATHRPEFGVNALAKEMKLDAATVRIKLRKAKVKKPYDFVSSAGVSKMKKQLEAA